jgi:spermidine synthase
LPTEFDIRTESTVPAQAYGQTATSPSGTYRNLFLISFLILFFELACIRWFGSTVVYLTFFTNIVLLATFLGMSVGCLTASSRRDWSRSVVPLLLVAVVAACGVWYLFTHVVPFQIDVGGQGSPQQVYFGTEYTGKNLSQFFVPIEMLAAVFFSLVALVFVGMGQVMGRAFNQAPDRVLAYTSNIAGSIVGIAAFALASYFRTRPVVWFAIALLLWCYFLKRRTWIQLSGMIVILAIVWFSGSYVSLSGVLNSRLPGADKTEWSPYYKILYRPKARLIVTNNIGYQTMVSIKDAGPAYDLLHLLNRDSGGKPFEDILIIGAGSGNDVQAALDNGAKHIDAVEIDPVILGIGRADHPNRPYADPRVTVHIDDGRSFIRKTDHKYDLIIFALVDSLVLHSGYSSLRLESFLFTQQSFDDIAARLKPDGVFAAYNFFRQGWIVGRIDKMATNAFGVPPLVISLPYVQSIRPAEPQSGISFLLASHNAPAMAAIANQFQQQQSFWINGKPSVNKSLNAFGPQPPATGDQQAWRRISPANVVTAGIDRVPTDDWPFLYLREARIPALNLRSMALIAVLSLIILYALSPVRRVRPNWQMFFLGAGFMLLETKGVVHMALLFGSTWLVNSVVFFAILVMILFSNLYVLAIKPKKLWPYYVLLSAALLLNILVPMSRFLALPGWGKVAVSCAVIFVPIFFAGIIFATSFRDSSQPDVDFGSNIAGAILGGLAENLSLMVGFNYLLLIALGFYLLSAVLRRFIPARVVAVPF